MEERHGSNKNCEHEDVAGSFCWHCWLEDLFQDREFIEQLEHAVARTLGSGAPRDDIDDVLQEVWLKLLARSRQLEGQKNTRGYVMSTVLGTALEFRRQRNEARKQTRVGWLSDESLHPVPGRARPPAEACAIHVLPRGVAPFDSTALRDALHDLARAARNYHSAAEGPSRKLRSKRYQELLDVLEKNELVSRECIAFMRKHNPKSRARRGVATLVATGRDQSLL